VERVKKVIKLILVRKRGGARARKICCTRATTGAAQGLRPHVGQELERSAEQGRPPPADCHVQVDSPDHAPFRRVTGSRGRPDHLGGRPRGRTLKEPHEEAPSDRQAEEAAEQKEGEAQRKSSKSEVRNTTFDQSSEGAE